MRTDPVRDNPIQFAVVREDPAVERARVDEVGAARVLLVASGGCTALSLAAERPGVAITVFDINAAQLDLLRRKQEGLGRPDRARRFNVGTTDPQGLNACGNFEALFRGLRRFIEDLVVPADELARAFDVPRSLAPTVDRIVGHRYWPVAFELFFHDALLHAMFGEAATQHAPPGSYPRWFRTAFEVGLRRPDAFDNYFLHHVLLGHYLDRPAALPAYLRAPAPTCELETVLGRLGDVPDLSRFDVIALSNLTDWMTPGQITELALGLRAARPGALCVLRQLNNEADLDVWLRDDWAPQEQLGASLLASDRSMFYGRVRVYRRRP